MHELATGMVFQLLLVLLLQRVQHANMPVGARNWKWRLGVHSSLTVNISQAAEWSSEK